MMKMLKRVIILLFIFCVATKNVAAVDIAQDLGFNKDDDSPVKITSQTVSLNANTRVFEYRGDVVVTKKDLELKSDSMAGTYNAQNKLEMIIFKDNVEITNGADISAKAGRAEYDVIANKITMTGSPEIIDKGNKLSADKIIFYVKDKRSEAQGNVRVDFINKTTLSKNE